MFFKFDYKRASNQNNSTFISERIDEVKQALTTANLNFTHMQFDGIKLSEADQVSSVGLPSWVFDATKQVDKSQNRYALEFRATDAIIIDLPKVAILFAFNRETGNSSVDNYENLAYYMMMTHVKGSISNPSFPVSFTNFIGELYNNDRAYPAKGRSGTQAFIITDNSFIWLLHNNSDGRYDISCGYSTLSNGEVIPFPTVRYPQLTTGVSDTTVVNTTVRSAMKGLYDVNYGDRILNKYVIYPYIVGFKNFGVLSTAIDLFDIGFSGAILQTYSIGGDLYIGTGFLNATICIRA